MKPSLLLMFIAACLHLLLLSDAQAGVRLLEPSREEHQILEGTGMDGGGGEEMIIPSIKEHSPSSGNGRKLFLSSAVHMAISATLGKKQQNMMMIGSSSSMVSDHTLTFEVAALGRNNIDDLDHDHHDLMDITDQMDYSPAKRKTPIHN